MTMQPAAIDRWARAISLGEPFELREDDMTCDDRFLKRHVASHVN